MNMRRKKIAAAMGFVPWLFASLAQAQTPPQQPPSAPEGGRLFFQLLSAGLKVTATEMKFGTLGTNISSGAIQVVLECQNGSVSSVDPNAVFEDETSCAAIDVTGRGEANYWLRMEVTELEDATGDNSISPTLVVYSDANEEITGLNNVQPGERKSASAPTRISAGQVVSYKVGGNMSVPAGQTGGTYRGEYTVLADVQ